MGADCGGGARSGDDPAPALKIEKQIGWSAHAEAGLYRTFGHDRELLVAGVEAGTLELWKLNGGKSWMITRIEGGELVVCCFQGSGLRDVAPYLYALAQRNKLRAIRYYSSFAAIARMLRRFGFEACETVYRCEVKPDEQQ